ncbi:MAG: recombination protein RecR [Planctomycetes bacterium]|nr:recombination protein RecR [Planctomycetota bacterium]
MPPLVESLARLIAELSSLPGIGERSAERIAFHLLRVTPDEARRLSEAILDVKARIRSCGTCSNLTEADPCRICADGSRDRSTICVVEQPNDLWAIEKAGSYRGLYHVLLGRIAPLEDIHPEDLTIARLVERVRAGGVTEVIFATNPTLEGDGTVLHIQRLLAASGVRLTRLARGIPAGSTLQYASPPSLADALDGRRPLG